MERKIFKSSSILIIILTLLISCKEKKQIDFSQAIYFANNINQIRDSIRKSNVYNTKLIICTFEKTDNYNKIKLLYPETPCLLHNNFDYRKIDGMNVVFVDFRDTVINSNQKILVKSLIKENIITFKGSHKNIEMPYLSFVFCQNDFNNIKCIDNITEIELENKSLLQDKKFVENVFHPECKPNKVQDN